MRDDLIWLWVIVLPHSMGLRVNMVPQVPLPGLEHSLVKELEPFFWIRWPVLGMRPDLWTVAVTHLVFTTAPTLKMLESSVKVCMHACVTWLVCPQYIYFVSLERHIIIVLRYRYSDWSWTFHGIVYISHSKSWLTVPAKVAFYCCWDGNLV